MIARSGSRDRRVATVETMIEERTFAGPYAFVAMDRIRVAHLTDLHVGRATPMRVQHEAVRRTSAARPDVVVVTGDFVCHP